jgi:hypothetical protein
MLQRCIAWPAPAGAEGWRCIAFDLSSSGVGLALPAPLPRGADLLVRPYGLPETAPPLHALVVRAVCVEGVWFTGCILVQPLSEEELAVWTGRLLADANEPDDFRTPTPASTPPCPGGREG